MQSWVIYMSTSNRGWLSLRLLITEFFRAGAEDHFCVASSCESMGVFLFFVFLSAVYYYISCHNIVLIKEVHFLGFMFINSFVQGHGIEL